jgi:hypothetical protein
MSGGIFMYETLEFYDSNGYDLKEVLKSCIYKYYIINKNLKINSDKTFKSDKKNSIINLTNEVKVLSSERS